MSKPAAIKGTYSEFKPVKTRKVVQVVIEVPIEHGQQVLEAFGFPQPDKEIWVGVALLKGSPEEKAEPEKRDFDDLALSQQSALLCQDKRFQRYLIETGHVRVEDDTPIDADLTDEAATAVRKDCRVNSRAQFDSNKDAANRWLDIKAGFKAWMVAP